MEFSERDGFGDKSVYAEWLKSANNDTDPSAEHRTAPVIHSEKSARARSPRLNVTRTGCRLIFLDTYETVQDWRAITFESVGAAFRGLLPRMALAQEKPAGYNERPIHAKKTVTAWQTNQAKYEGVEHVLVLLLPVSGGHRMEAGRGRTARCRRRTELYNSVSAEGRSGDFLEFLR